MLVADSFLDRSKRSCAILGVALLIPALSFAKIPEPANIVYGTVAVNGTPLSATDSDWTVQLTANGGVVSSYRMGESAPAGDRYVLTIPLDAVDPRSPNTARTGDTGAISLLVNGVSYPTVPPEFTVGDRGSVAELDLAATTDNGVDTDGDGIPDAIDPDDDNVAPQAVRLLSTPFGLNQILDAKRASAKDMFADSQGSYIVFATEDSLLATDTNGLSDVYLYETWSTELELVSRSLGGIAGNGASTQPRIDGGGENVVYVSEASDLTEDDSNQAADIYHYSVHAKVNRRVSWTSEGMQAAISSANPAIGEQGQYVLYDRRGDRGVRHIYGWDHTVPWRGAHEMSLAEGEQGQLLDSHHPGISPDGRFIAYLETVHISGETAPQCAIHVYNRFDGRYARVPCPAVFGADAIAFPYFSEDGNTISWFLDSVPDAKSSGQRWEYVMDNPLAVSR